MSIQINRPTAQKSTFTSANGGDATKCSMVSIEMLNILIIPKMKKMKNASLFFRLHFCLFFIFLLVSEELPT